MQTRDHSKSMRVITAFLLLLLSCSTFSNTGGATPQPEYRYDELPDENRTDAAISEYQAIAQWDQLEIAYFFINETDALTGDTEHELVRQAFALWQKDRRVSVIAEDGTVLEPFVAPALVQLPLVVGEGAETRAKAFLALLERYPAIRDQVRASILVGERRWNLRLRNGLDIRLPESNAAAAFDRLIALERDNKLTTRDIAAIDLRLPDRITVRLSPAAAQSRLDAAKDRKPAAKKAGPV